MKRRNGPGPGSFTASGSRGDSPAAGPALSQGLGGETDAMIGSAQESMGSQDSDSGGDRRWSGELGEWRWSDDGERRGGKVESHVAAVEKPRMSAIAEFSFMRRITVQ